jgi:uncharacterized membrane protein YdbT with pleckstrin-like domain
MAKVVIESFLFLISSLLSVAFIFTDLLSSNGSFSDLVSSGRFWFYTFVAFSAIIFIYAMIVKFNYAATRYELKADGLVYAEGFLNTVNKEIKWRRVIEISLKRNVWQRFFDLGTVVVSTAATGDATGGQMSSTGIHLADLENYEEAYKIIKTAFEKTN